MCLGFGGLGLFFMSGCISALILLRSALIKHENHNINKVFNDLNDAVFQLPGWSMGTSSLVGGAAVFLTLPLSTRLSSPEHPQRFPPGCPGTTTKPELAS